MEGTDVATGGRAWWSPARAPALALTAPPLLVLVVVLLWVARRGFDFTDEGMYLIDYRRGSIRPTDFSQYQVILRALVGGRELGVIGNRQLHLTGDVLTGVMLGGAAALVLSPRNRYRSVAAPAACSGAIFGLLGWAWLPPTTSYNSVNAWQMNLELCAFLAVIGADRDWVHRISAVVLGALLGLHVFVKPSAMFLLLLLLTASVCVIRRSLRPAVLVLGSAIVTAVVLDAGLRAFSVETVLEASRRFSESTTHGLGVLPDYYAMHMRNIAKLSVDGASRVALTVVLAALVSSTTCRASARWSAPLAMSYLTLAWLTMTDGFGPISGNSFEKSIVMIAALIACTGQLWSHRHSASIQGLPLASRDRNVVGGTLLVAPMLAFVGSSNPPAMVLMGLAAPVGVLLCISALSWSSGKDPASGVAVWMVLVVVVTAQIWHGSIYEPYRQPPLTQAVVKDNALDGVLVAPDSARFIGELRSVWGAVGKGDDRALVLNSLSGIPYVLGIDPPGHSWTPDTDPDRVCDEMSIARRELAETHVLFAVGPVQRELMHCLDELWPDFSRLVELTTIRPPEGLDSPSISVWSDPTVAAGDEDSSD